MSPNSRLFGIRHHGPGSARSLRRALEALRPDVLLLEGPPEAEAVLPLAAHPEMQPPVALLLFVPEHPPSAGTRRRAVFYPFARFSPEWQALQYALTRGIPLRFMDLPQSHQLALRPEAEAPPAPGDPGDRRQATGDRTGRHSEEPPPPAADDPDPRTQDPTPYTLHPTPDPAPPLWQDPLRWLAEAAGYRDHERWWEQMVEHRRDDADLFAAILEAMIALREEERGTRRGRSVLAAQRTAIAQGDPGHPAGPREERGPDGSPLVPPHVRARPGDRTDPSDPSDPSAREHEALREAFMRQTLRTAQREGFQRIAVVCGAWHAPALADLGSAAADAGLLKGLPKVRVQATWVPWTYGRLAMESGYGAGIASPGWYDHLWHMGEAERPPVEVAVRWATSAARLLREEGIDVSSAHVIEAVRLAESLAALRGQALPGLAELGEAVRAVLLFGDDAPMRLIREKLIVGERLGQVPAETPIVPLQGDLQREQKRLRLAPEASQRALDLDLRRPVDLERSHLLHRLALLGIPWGVSDDAGRAHPQAGTRRGTFHERWRLQWQPEFAVGLIEAGVWGNTILDAATAFTRDAADRAPDLPTLTGLVERALLADLPDSVRHLMARVAAESAIASDVAHLMDALPPLANVLRYGSVRQTDTDAVRGVVEGLAARICIGLPGACASLNDEAAAAMFRRLLAVHGAFALLEEPERVPGALWARWAAWHRVLRQLADQQGLHGLLAGRACRLLLDAHVFDAAEAAGRLSRALSRAAEPAAAAAWIEGLLTGSGLLLLHDDALWQVLDAWVTERPAEGFTEVLPLLRRTFATFPAPERRQMGERVRRGPAAPSSAAAGEDLECDPARAEAVLPLIARLLGLE